MRKDTQPRTNLDSANAVRLAQCDFPSRAALAGKLRYVRTLRQLTRRELEIKAALGRGTVGRLERATQSINVEALDKLAEVLGVPAWGLLLPHGP